MPKSLIGLVVIAVAVALSAYRNNLRIIYLISKLVASLSFVALAYPAVHGTLWQRVAFFALIASAFGDVALALRGRLPFVIGLVSFALAHTAFTVAFAVRGLWMPLAAAFALVALLAAALAWNRGSALIPAALRLPVAVYGCIVCLMAATGLASAISRSSLLLAFGALLVPGSDIAVARERFGVPSFGNKLLGLPAYYMGQVLIVLSMLK